jgi:hypothetical protein
MHLSAMPPFAVRGHRSARARWLAGVPGISQRSRVAPCRSLANTGCTHTNFLEKPDMASHNPVRCGNATMAWPATEFPEAKDEAEHVRWNARGVEAEPDAESVGPADAAAMAQTPLSGPADGRKFTVEGCATVFSIGCWQNALRHSSSGYPAPLVDRGRRSLLELDVEVTDFIQLACARIMWSCKNINAKHPPSATPAPISYQCASSRGGWVPVADPCTTLNKWSGR